MKKFLPVIIGLIVGIIVSTGLIVIEKNRVAYGEEGVNWWNSMVAGADNDWFDWQDVFTPLGPSEKGKNLYNLIYKKLTRQSGKDAIKQVAKNNGLTVEEARAIVNGSFAPILNNPKYSNTLTQDNAAKIMARMQENFADLSELYQIQQEVDVSIAPGEMFANGDLSDSGFDLVKDLSLIEEILFVKKSPQTIGGAFADPYGSPYNPTEDDKILADNVPNELGTTFLPLTEGAGGAGKGPGDGGVINIGDKKIEAEILDKDICEPLNNLGGGLDDYDKKHGGGKKDDVPDDNGGDAGGDDDDDDDDDGDDGDDDGGGDDDGVPTVPKTKAAPADDWAKEWCANYKEPGVFAGIGASGFKSLGGVSTNYIFGGNAAANYDNNLVKMNLGVCFDIKMIPKKVSSFLPGDTCILCEVEKINQFLDKTLSHTLMPNKATGNLMESAKCKNSAQMPLINLQFIVIWNPVPTPINDKLIFGKNLFEEWNNYLSRYQPILSTKRKNNYELDERPDLTDDFNIKLQEKMMASTATQSAIVSSISKIKAEAAAEASLKVKTVEIGNEVANTMVYSRSVLQEIKQMNALFENFKNTFETTNKEALKKIVNDKPNVK